VTSTLVFEGSGRVVEYPGGYEDWVRQRPKVQSAPARRAGGARTFQHETVQSRPRKLSYKEQQEFEQLPTRIEALESEQLQLQALVSGPMFYTQPAPEIARILARLAALDELLLQCYARWDAFDSRTVDVSR
jgi:ATP-binding cassette subfamily F protein uup